MGICVSKDKDDQGPAAEAQKAAEKKLAYAAAGQDPATEMMLQSLGAEKVVAGLKEALTIGIAKAVELCGATDGFMNNPKIRIPLPPVLDVVREKLLENEMGKKLVESFEEALNRAAEKSAPKAATIFKDGIGNMSIDDVKRVWKGGDTSCTDFLQSSCGEPLKAAMKTDCDEVIESNQVTKIYAQIIDQVKDVPMAGDLVKAYDIKDYTLQKALDGLYHMMGEEETKIRQNPAARTTDLLSSVFTF